MGPLDLKHSGQSEPHVTRRHRRRCLALLPRRYSFTVSNLGPRPNAVVPAVGIEPAAVRGADAPLGILERPATQHPGAATRGIDPSGSINGRAPVAIVPVVLDPLLSCLWTARGRRWMT